MIRVFCNLRVGADVFGLKRFHTGAVTYGRSRRYDNNPGVGKRAEIFADDPEFINSLEDEEDIAGLESDFADADVSYNENNRLNRRHKMKVDLMITKRKFFADPPEPSMLTWIERLQIKKLHSDDPETWTLDVLADSFPATREIISKVLRQKWKPDSKKKMKKMDDNVHRNWKLLAEGKLEASERLLKHLNNFLPRREDHLAALQNENIAGLFEPPKEKLVWNNGQMSKILESYEKSLASLEEKKNEVLMIENEGLKLQQDSAKSETFLIENLPKSETVTLDQLKSASDQKEKNIDVLQKEKNSVTKKLEEKNTIQNDEEETIKDTFFWPSPQPTQQKGSEKTSPVVKNAAPQRIKVPKNQQGRGLTFKVNDSFYDDDGEFLYRVPGLKESNKG